MSPEINDVIDEIQDKLPKLLKDVVDEVMKGFAIIEPFLGWFSESARGKMANTTGHTILVALKEVGWDKFYVRVFLIDLLRIMYNLPSTWDPKWPVNPPDLKK